MRSNVLNTMNVPVRSSGRPPSWRTWSTLDARNPFLRNCRYVGLHGVDGEHVAGHQAVAHAAIDDDHFILADDRDAVRYRHDAALHRALRRARDEVERHIDAAREQLVAGIGLARRFGHDERRRVAAAGYVSRAGENAVVAQDAVVVRIAQRLADAHQVVAHAELGGLLEAAAYTVLPSDMTTWCRACASTYGAALICSFVEHRGLGHEGGDGFVGDRRDRRLERLAAHPRLHARGIAALESRLQHDPRPAVDVHEVQRVARIDQVGVLHLGIHLPYFGPVPGIRRNTLAMPQSVSPRLTT